MMIKNHISESSIRMYFQVCLLK